MGTGTRGGIRRARLMDALADQRDVPVLLVEAASGYGKTTLVDQWAAEDGRAVTTLRLRARHDDPVLLLDALLSALDVVEPVGQSFRRIASTVDVDFSSVVLPA